MARMQICSQMIGMAGLAAMLPSCGNQSASVSLPAVAVVDNDTTRLTSPTPTPTSSPAPASDQTVLAGVIVQAGDSIGAGLGANDWAAIDHLGFSASVIIHNASVSGKSMQTGYGYRVSEIFSFRSQTSPSILLIQQGTNDIYYGTGAYSLYKNTLTQFISDARKAGFYVIVNTILPRSDSGWTAAMERERIAYNILVRANRASADAINDLAADPVMGDISDQVNSGFYADGAHPSLAGQQRLAVLNAAVLKPFLQRPIRPLSR